MSEFNIGHQIVSRTLMDGSPKPFLDMGWDYAWANDVTNITRLAVFPGQEMDAWRFILDHWDRHGRVPNQDLFGLNFSGYVLHPNPSTPDELIEIASDNVRAVAVQDAMGDLAELQQIGAWDAIIERATRLLALMQNQGQSASSVAVWDEGGRNVDDLLNRKVRFGIGLGVPEIDNQPGFNGFQPGNLVTLLGRAKAGKTSFALLSAITAAMVRYKRVMVVTVEISKDNIYDRFDAYQAKVSLSRLMTGGLHPDEKDRVRRVYADKGEYEPLLYIVEPKGQYTVTQLEADIDRYQPDYVIIDGFYFMKDRESGEMGGHWKGHDGLAGDLKAMAMRRKLVVAVTHQVREKQMGGKKGAGIDDGAMMGGTGLIMFSDMVIGIDINEDHENKISCTRSRTGYLATVRGQWDWNTCTFMAYENEEDWVDSEAA